MFIRLENDEHLHTCWFAIFPLAPFETKAYKDLPNNIKKDWWVTPFIDNFSKINNYIFLLSLYVISENDYIDTTPKEEEERIQKYLLG